MTQQFSARTRMDHMAENRGWAVSHSTVLANGNEQPVCTYTAGRYELMVVWTLCDHVSRAKLTRTDTGLVDKMPEKFGLLPDLDRWNKRFSWVAVRLFDLAPTDLSVVPHARARSTL